ncbi:hypothetical protein KH5_22050 [Urechidicola sp. KH5]
MISLKEITFQKGIKDFVTFPFRLYKNNQYWVPPIISEEISNFDPTKNPVFKHASAQYFIAYKNNEPVGRVAAIINKKETEEQGFKKMRFGWFDVIDDIEVTQVLINKVAEIGKANNLEFMEGPVGFSNLDKVGVLTEGFDYRGTMITWYNHPYYKTHFKQLGFYVGKQYREHITLFKNVPVDKLSRMNKMISSRYNLTTLNFTKTSQIMPHVDEMFDLFNESYSELASFVPISNDQKAYFKKKFIGFINPEFIKFVVDKDHKIVAFAITLPSFSKALQKAKGKLWPFGVFHLLRAKKKNEDVILYLIGVHPTYRNKGVTALIMHAYATTYKDFGIKRMIRTPELEENETARRIWKDYQDLNHKRRCTFKKDL